MNPRVIRADYTNPQHAQAIGVLLDAYASDPMGGGAPLSRQVRECIADALADLPRAFSLLAMEGRDYVGLANCMEGFSTFSCAPLINIHDFYVRASHRGLGISRIMMNAVEAEARQRGCCKITLEVLSGNAVAKSAYRNFGFSDYALDPESGSALFWQKML